VDNLWNLLVNQILLKHADLILLILEEDFYNNLLRKLGMVPKLALLMRLQF